MKVLKIILYIALALSGVGAIVYLRNRNASTTAATKPKQTVDFSNVAEVKKVSTLTMGLPAHFDISNFMTPGLTVDQQVSKGIEAKIGIPTGAKRGKVPNTFTFNGYWYKFDAKGVTPERFTGGSAMDGTWKNTWIKALDYPVSQYVAAGLNPKSGLYLFKAGQSQQSFMIGHTVFTGENFGYVILDNGVKHESGGAIVNQMVKWKDGLPYMTNTTLSSDGGAAMVVIGVQRANDTYGAKPVNYAKPLL